MSASTLALDTQRVQATSKVRDYLDLTRPRIGAMVLVTVAVGAFLGGWGVPDVWLLAHTLVATALIASSATAFNQLLERETDARMPRTAGRPLPSGRLAPWQVALFGTALISLGFLHLAMAVNLLTAALGLLTWLVYVWIYTPLKSRTTANTAVGAVSGALPVLIGWAAVGGELGIEAATLFVILYLWQFPHFMAIAWIYRRQYADAGLRMLSVVDQSGRGAGLQAVLSALVLVPISLMPAANAQSWLCFGVALLLGLGQLAAAVMFFRQRDESSARTLLRASLIYLPLLFAMLILMPLA